MINILENKIEKELKKVVEAEGGLCLKFISPGFKGVPDRIVLLPKGVIYFVELKAPGKKLSPLQEKRKTQLEELGFNCVVIDKIEDVKQ